jgi:anti-sigma B factor antagonist
MNHADKLVLRTEIKEGRCTVFVGGELDLASAGYMRAALSPLVGITDRELTLNLGDLQYVDSTGIGIIVSVLKARHANKGPFSVEAVPPKIRRLFDMTGITPFLQEQAGHA